MDLTLEGVTKFYGPVIGINNVSCRIGPGITGLLGANGAGKSTLIKLASGQLRPDQGRVLIGGRGARSTAARRSMGYSPDINSFYEEMTAREFLATMAGLYGYPPREVRRRTDEALAEVGMMSRAHRRLAGCSHGMRQRVKLAQALVHDPAVLLLDEPLAGIDPGGRREINDLLGDLARRGKTVLLSSHILVEVESVADSMLVIARGRIVASGTMAEVRKLLEDRPLVVELATDQPRRLAAMLCDTADVRGVAIFDGRLRVETRNPARFHAHLARLVREQGFTLTRMQSLDSGIDAVFNYLQGPGR